MTEVYNSVNQTAPFFRVCYLKSKWD